MGQAQERPVPLWAAFDHKTSQVDFYLSTPSKHPENPVLVPEHPWEGNAVYLYGTVRYNSGEERYEMWYQTYDHDAPAGHRTFICYAVSSDGIEWKRPSLGEVEYDDSFSNNIILEPRGNGDIYAPSVVVDPEGPPSRRYKMIYSDWSTQEKGSIVHGAYSSDGRSWTRFSWNPLPPVSTDALSLLPQKINGHFILFTKSGRVATRNRKRGIARSEDFREWTEEEIYRPGDFGPEFLEPYWMSASVIRGRGFGMTGIYDTRNGEIFPVFAYSENFRRWETPRKNQPAIPLGSQGAFDSSMIFVQSNVFLPVGDEIWTYYGGWNGEHEQKDREGAIGIARWPRERFLGMHVGSEGGQVEVENFRTDRSFLTVSVEVEKEGVVAAGLYNSTTGDPIRGFGQDQFDPIRNSGSRVPLSWNGKGNLEEVEEHRVTLRLYARNATLYAFDDTSEISLERPRPKSSGSIFRDRVHAVYPNPAKNSFTLEAEFSRDKNAYVAIYDVLGRVVKEIESSSVSEGYHSFRVSTSDMSSGRYFIKIKSGKFLSVKNLHVVR